MSEISQSKYIAPDEGIVKLVSFWGIPEVILKDPEILEHILIESLKADNFQVMNYSDYRFSPMGYTASVILAESHANIHTFPEYNCLRLNLEKEKAINAKRRI